MAVIKVENIPAKKVGKNFYMPPLFKVHLDGDRDPFFIVQKRAEPYVASNVSILNGWDGKQYIHHSGGGGKNQWLTYSFNVGVGLQYPYWMTQFYGAWSASSTSHGARGSVHLYGIKNGNTITDVGLGNGAWYDICTNDSLKNFLDPDLHDTIQLWCQAYGTGSSWWAGNTTAGNVCRRVIKLNDIETIIYKL